MSSIILTKANAPAVPKTNQIGIFVNESGVFSKIDELGSITVLGAQGTNGNIWYIGTTAPSNSVGVEHDFYLNSTNGDYYQKNTNSWSLVGNLTGPQGIQGIQGIQGPKGDTGDIGAGIASGGTTGQILSKNSNTNYDTTWINPPEGSGGGIPNTSTDYFTITATKTKASSTVNSGYQSLVYGIQISNTSDTVTGLVDMYYYDASSATEYLLFKDITITVGNTTTLGGLEPMFVMDAGDEIRLLHTAGTSVSAIYHMTKLTDTKYEMGLHNLTTSAVSQLTAVSGNTKRIVSMIAGNSTTNTSYTVTVQVYDGSTSYTLVNKMAGTADQMPQIYADGLGPTLQISHEIRALASADNLVTMIVVAKVIS